MGNKFNSIIKILILTVFIILAKFNFGLGLVFFNNDKIGILDIIICIIMFVIFVFLLKIYLNKLQDVGFYYLGFDPEYTSYDTSAGIIYSGIILIISNAVFFMTVFTKISVNIDFSFYVLGFYFIYCIYEAFSQEVLFRCILFRNLNESTTIPTNVVIIIVNIAFALLSMIGSDFNLLRLISLFLVGLMFSLFYKKHRNLYIPIAFHAFLKFITVAFLAEKTKYIGAKFMSFEIVSDSLLPKILADSFTDIYLNPIFIVLVSIVIVFLYVTADEY